MLACISSDLYTSDTFEEFCEEYGFETDSRKAEKQFRACTRFATKLRGFFTDEEERTALGEIR